MKLKETCSNSYFIDQITKHRSECGISVVLAMLSTLVSYPGIWYSDSYARVIYADSIMQKIENMFEGARRIYSKLGYYYSIIFYGFM